MSTTFPNVIGGQAVDSGDRTTDVNPSNLSDVVGEFARGSNAELDAAIAAARQAIQSISIPRRPAPR